MRFDHEQAKHIGLQINTPVHSIYTRACPLFALVTMLAPLCTPRQFCTIQQLLPRLVAVNNPPTGGTLMHFEGGLVGLSTNSNLTDVILPHALPALEFFIATNTRIVVILDTQPVISLTLERVNHLARHCHDQPHPHEAEDSIGYDSDRSSNASDHNDEW